MCDSMPCLPVERSRTVPFGSILSTPRKNNGVLFQVTAQGADLSPSKCRAAVLFAKGMMRCTQPGGSCPRAGHAPVAGALNGNAVAVWLA